jgi:hypothetical protein
MKYGVDWAKIELISLKSDFWVLARYIAVLKGGRLELTGFLPPKTLPLLLPLTPNPCSAPLAPPSPCGNL